MNWLSGLDGNLRGKAEAKLSELGLELNRQQRIATIFARRVLQLDPGLKKVSAPMRFLETLIAAERRGELRGGELEADEPKPKAPGRHDTRVSNLRGDVASLQSLLEGAGQGPAREGLEKQLRSAEAALEQALRELRGGLDRRGA